MRGHRMRRGLQAASHFCSQKDRAPRKIVDAVGAARYGRRMSAGDAGSVVRPFGGHFRERLPSRESWFTLGGFVALYAAYATLVRDVVQNGDAAVYNEQIETHAFASYLIHVGYIALGSLFHALVPVHVDRGMNLLALTLGIGAAAALYATGKLWGSRLAGLSGVLFLLCSSDYVRAMVLCEVDILSAALVGISYAFYVRGRPVASGLLFGLGMLCTPVSMGMLPLFAFTFALDERGLAVTARAQAWRVLRFGLAGLALYLPWVAAHFHDYFYGARGVFTSPYARFDAAVQIARGAQFFKDNTWALLPLSLTGLLQLLLDKARWRREQPALGILFSVLATVLIDRAGDVPVHLASIATLALCAALLLDRLASASKIVWAIPCFAFALMGIPAYRAALGEVEEDVQIRNTYQEMRRQSLPLRPMLAGLPPGFSMHRRFDHYAIGDSHAGLAPSLTEVRRRLRELRSGPEEYTIYFAGHLPKDIEQALEDRYVPALRTVNGERYRVLVPRSGAH